MKCRRRFLLWGLALAVLNICGFESGDSVECRSSAGTFSVQNSTTRGAWSDYALRVNPTTTATGSVEIGTQASTGEALAANAATVYARFYFRYATKPSANDEECFVVLDTFGSGKLFLRLNSSGNLAAYDGFGVLATGTTVLAANTWYRIEFKAGSGLGGAWEVKIDGTSEISGTGNLGSNNGSIKLGKVTDRNGKTVDFFYDDVSWSDSAYPGAGQVSSVLPNAAGNYQTWTIGAGAGSNFQQVDEVPHDGDTTYLLSDLVAGDAETEALESASSAGVSGTIAAVKAFAVLKQNSSPTSACRLRLRSGSTDSDTATNYLPTASYALIAKMFETDPATSAAWTTGGIDGAEAGAVEKSGGDKTRMTLCGLMVDYVAAVSTPPIPVACVARRETHYAELYE